MKKINFKELAIRAGGTLVLAVLVKALAYFVGMLIAISDSGLIIALCEMFFSLVYLFVILRINSEPSAWRNRMQVIVILSALIILGEFIYIRFIDPESSWLFIPSFSMIILFSLQFAFAIVLWKKLLAPNKRLKAIFNYAYLVTALVDVLIPIILLFLLFVGLMILL